MRHYCTKQHEKINLQCTQTVILILTPDSYSSYSAFTHTMHYKHKVTVYSPETGKSTERSSIQYQATTGLDKEVKVIIVLWIWRKSWQESQHRGYSALIHVIHKHTVNRCFTWCCLNWREEENNMSLSEFQITCQTKKQTNTIKDLSQKMQKGFLSLAFSKCLNFTEGKEW